MSRIVILADNYQLKLLLVRISILHAIAISIRLFLLFTAIVPKLHVSYCFKPVNQWQALVEMVYELIDPIYESKQPKKSGKMSKKILTIFEVTLFNKSIEAEINRTRTISLFYFYFIEARERGKSVWNDQINFFKCRHLCKYFVLGSVVILVPPKVKSS